MRKMTTKEEWLRCCGGILNRSSEDEWLRDKITDLFNVENPTPSQERLLCLADLLATLLDLPYGAYPNYEQELRELARKEFGKYHRDKDSRWRRR